HTGTDAPPVFDLDGVKVGVMICFDWRFPETARSLALKGAEIIAHPSNLVLPHCPQAMITRCLENRIFAITADRVGEEERIPGEKLAFIGQSQVVDPDGNILVRASETEEEVHIVDIDLENARDKYLNPKNEIFKDRRPDLYR
nr:acyltransferase [Nitrospinota bacterium]